MSIIYSLIYFIILIFAWNVQVHSKNFNVGVQALMLLDKISAKNHIVSDRFYRALYAKLLLPTAMNSSKVRGYLHIYILLLSGLI